VGAPLPALPGDAKRRGLCAAAPAIAAGTWLSHSGAILAQNRAAWPLDPAPGTAPAPPVCVRECMYVRAPRFELVSRDKLSSVAGSAGLRGRNGVTTMAFFLYGA